VTERFLERSFFHRPAETVAREVIGSVLLFHGVGGVIIETEAYDDEDPASHSARGITVRNRSMSRILLSECVIERLGKEVIAGQGQFFSRAPRGANAG